MTYTDRDAFTISFRSFQRGAVMGGLVAMVTFVGLMCALLPVAATIRQFFRTQIGGDLGEVLLGISFPLMASPPAIIFFFWYWRRSKDSNLRCRECGYWLATESRFKSVLEDSRCPKCSTEQFPQDREV
jgi:hypothetical protein